MIIGVQVIDGNAGQLFFVLPSKRNAKLVRVDNKLDK